MITYGIGVIPLIIELRDTHPCVTQPWYADDTGVGGGGWEHHRTLPVPAGEGATAGLLPGTNLEYLGCGPAERGKGKGFLPRNEYKYPYMESVPWGFCRRQGSRGQLVGGEGSGLDGVG